MHHPLLSSPLLVHLVTANDADMCATAATDAGVVTEFGGGGRKEEERDVRGREGGGAEERGDGQRGQRVDNGPDYDYDDDDERASEGLN